MKQNLEKAEQAELPTVSEISDCYDFYVEQIPNWKKMPKADSYDKAIATIAFGIVATSIVRPITIWGLTVDEFHMAYQNGNGTARLSSDGERIFIAQVAGLLTVNSNTTVSTKHFFRHPETKAASSNVAYLFFNEKQCIYIQNYINHWRPSKASSVTTKLLLNMNGGFLHLNSTNEICTFFDTGRQYDTKKLTEVMTKFWYTWRSTAMLPEKKLSLTAVRIASHTEHAEKKGPSDPTFAQFAGHQ